MKIIHFTWDDRKSRSNQKKHGVSFEEAQTVFHDANARLIYDTDHSSQEERFILLGVSAKLRVLVVCHCYRGDDGLIRIVSARKATKKEQQQYLSFPIHTTF